MHENVEPGDTIIRIEPKRKYAVSEEDEAWKPPRLYERKELFQFQSRQAISNLEL